MSRSDDWITARLYGLAAESAPAGARLHAAADQGVPFRRIAKTAGHRLDVPARTISPAQAEAHLGFLPALAAPGNPTSSATSSGGLVGALSWDRRLARPGLGTRLVALNSAAQPVVWLSLACAGRVRPAGPAGLAREGA